MNKVLLVDDQEQSLYLLKTMLGGNGYQVLEATNGAEALAQARANPPDVVISDILMPVMDGFSLCQEWKKDVGLRNIPFVFYTATYTDPKDQELALSLGAARFLVKPVETEEFVSMLRQLLAEVESGTLAAPESHFVKKPRTTGCTMKRSSANWKRRCWNWKRSTARWRRISPNASGRK
jgi:CheY-like chemotaxis protein